jgi:hypothetical protein
MPEQSIPNKDFARIYAESLQLADIVQHPEFLSRELRILDVDGKSVNSEALSNHLQGLEEAVSITSPKDFPELVDSISLEVDFVDGFMAKQAVCDPAYLLSLLVCTGEKFDYILSLNNRPDTRQFQPRSATSPYHHPLNSQILLSDKPIYGGLLSHVDFINLQSQAIELLSASLLLLEGGTYVRGGIITLEDIKSVNDFKKQHGLDLINIKDAKSIENANLDLSLDTAKELSGLHRENSCGVTHERLAEVYSKNFRLIPYRQKRQMYGKEQYPTSSLLSELLLNYRRSCEHLAELRSYITR